MKIVSLLLVLFDKLCKIIYRTCIKYMPALASYAFNGPRSSLVDVCTPTSVNYHFTKYNYKMWI